MSTEQKVAEALVAIGAVRFNFKDPITFKSGIKSSVYIDNREFPFHPKLWEIVIDGFKDLITKDKISFDVLAGVAVGGVPHSSALGFVLGKPSLFVRKEAKDHGTKNLVEGGDIKGKKVLLIEDLVSTGVSSLNAVKEIRKAGGVVDDCLVIVSYNFAEAKVAFKNANVKLHALTSFPVILEEIKKVGLLKEVEIAQINKWLADYSTE